MESRTPDFKERFRHVKVFGLFRLNFFNLNLQIRNILFLRVLHIFILVFSVILVVLFIDQAEIGRDIWQFGISLSQEYDRVIEASGNRYNFQVHSLGVLVLAGALADFYGIISQIGNLSRGWLVVDIAVAELTVVSSAEREQMPIFTD